MKAVVTCTDKTKASELLGLLDSQTISSAVIWYAAKEIFPLLRDCRWAPDKKFIADVKATGGHYIAAPEECVVAHSTLVDAIKDALGITNPQRFYGRGTQFRSDIILICQHLNINQEQ